MTRENLKNMAELAKSWSEEQQLKVAVVTAIVEAVREQLAKLPEPDRDEAWEKVIEIIEQC